jgi:hypothetical protein
MAVRCRDADAEISRIGLGELRNIVGDRPGAVARNFSVATLQKPEQRGPDALIPA